MARKPRRPHGQPSLEGLEDRKLLSGDQSSLLLPNGQLINEGDHQRLVVQLRAASLDPQNLRYKQASKAVLPTLPERRKAFRMDDGTVTVITLYGAGTLRGTAKVGDALDIRYDNTNAASRIIARNSHSAPGASGRVRLRSLRDVDVPFGSVSGVGSNQIGIVNLPDYDLIEGGIVNLSGGVQIVQLGIIGPNTLFDIRSLPLPSNVTLPVDNVQVPSATFVATAGGGAELAGVGGLTVPGALSTGGVSAPSGFTTRINANGEIELVPVSGSSDGADLVPGATILVDAIEGRGEEPSFARAQIFGYDPTTRQLIQFDTATGAQQGLRIQVPATPAPNDDAGVGLARLDGNLVVLVGVGTEVFVYDVLTGESRGQFDTSNLGADWFVSGIAQTDTNPVLVSGFTQQALTVNLAQSLAQGRAVAAGAVFNAPDTFPLSGGATGAAGISSVALTGASYFTPFSPLSPSPQFGVMTASISRTSGAISTTATTAVSSPGSIVDDVPPTNPPFAFGSVGPYAALVTSVDTTRNVNVVTLYNPTSSFASAGTINLNIGTRLTALSESFHPELDGEAVINVQGVLTRIVGGDATGLVLNGVGYLNTIDFHRMTDSTIIGLPVGHIAIEQRQNVTILSSDDRPVGTQGGVTIVPNLVTPGALAPPRLRR